MGVVHLDPFKSGLFGAPGGGGEIVLYPCDIFTAGVFRASLEALSTVWLVGRADCFPAVGMTLGKLVVAIPGRRNASLSAGMAELNTGDGAR